jgi:hypothetical protein
MALTINRFLGAETGGLEELSATSGTVTASNTGGRAILSNDSWYYQIQDASSYIEYTPFSAGVSDSGGDYILGFAVEFNNLLVAFDICEVSDSTGAVFSLGLLANGNLVVRDSAGSTIRTITSPFAISTRFYIEVFFQHSNSGTIEVFIDNVSQGSDSSQDLLQSGTIQNIKHYGRTGTNSWYNDIYFGSGATSSADRLGPCEVISYRSSLASATPDNGTALDTGTWANAQEIPFSETNVAAYTASSADSGIVNTDDVGGSAGTGGPNTDANVDVADIKAISGIWRMKRSGGSGATHFGRLGNSGDTASTAEQTADFDPTTAYTNYFHLTEAAARIPASGEYLAIGIEKSSGGQDFDCSDMLAQILHVLPDTGRTATLDETLGALTLSADGDIDIAATATPTLGAVTLVSATAIDIAAIVSKALDALVLSSDASVGGLTADADITLGALLLTSDASLPINAALTKTLDTLVLSSASALDILADADNTFDDLLLSSDTSITVSAALTKTLEALAISSGASLADHPAITFKGGFGDNAFASLPFASKTVSTSDFNAVVNEVLDNLVLSSDGSLDIAAVLNQTLAALTLTSATAVDIQAVLSATLTALTLSSSAVIDIQSTLTATLDDIVLTADARLDITGDVSVTLGSIVLVSDTGVLVQGEASNLLDALTLASDATVGTTADLSITFDDGTLVSAGTVDIGAIVNALLDELVVSSDGITDLTIESNTALEPVVLSSDTSIDIVATAVNTLGELILDAAGSSLTSGNVSLVATLGDVSLSAVFSVTTGLGGFYQPADVPDNNDVQGGGFWNSDTPVGAEKIGFWSPDNKTPGKGGGFYQ